MSNFFNWITFSEFETILHLVTSFLTLRPYLQFTLTIRAEANLISLFLVICLGPKTVLLSLQSNIGIVYQTASKVSLNFEFSSVSWKSFYFLSISDFIGLTGWTFLYGTDSLMLLWLRFHSFYFVTNLFYKDPVGKKSLSKTFMGYPWGQTVTTLVL